MGHRVAAKPKPKPRPRRAAPSGRRPARRRPGGRHVPRSRAVPAYGGPVATTPYRARTAILRDGHAVKVRAIRPEDDVALKRAFKRLSPRSRYLRLMQHKRELDTRALARAVRPQAGREFALVATVPDREGYDIVGAARYVQAEGDPAACEFAITVADDWAGKGLATTLLRSLMRRARSDGYARIEGAVLAYNDAMLALARGLHFDIQWQPGDATLVQVRRQLIAGR